MNWLNMPCSALGGPAAVPLVARAPESGLRSRLPGLQGRIGGESAAQSMCATPSCMPAAKLTILGASGGGFHKKGVGG